MAAGAAMASGSVASTRARNSAKRARGAGMAAFCHARASPGAGHARIVARERLSEGRHNVQTDITQQAFGTLPDGRPVTQYTLTNRNGMLVRILDFGAIITEI